LCARGTHGGEQRRGGEPGSQAATGNSHSCLQIRPIGQCRSSAANYAADAVRHKRRSGTQVIAPAPSFLHAQFKFQRDKRAIHCE
jgi:hypothetical protein